jgi:hypothetical protein
MTATPPSTPSAIESGKLYFEHLFNENATAAAQLKKEALAKIKFLYRYRPLSGYGLDELITGRTYMARPDQLNDPYECQLLINRTGKYKPVLGSAWSALHYFEKQVHCAALCEDPRLLLMWAHYANRPSGCCLEFRTDELLQSEQSALGLHPVVYGDQLYDGNEPLQAPPERLRAILLRMACHKLRPWEYEREWRLVSLQVKEPQNPQWPGVPLEKWAPNLKVEEQSQIAGYTDGGSHFINLPIPTRIILLGDKLDTNLDRMLRGISRLSGVPLALAERTPDAETESQLEIRNL